MTVTNHALAGSLLAAFLPLPLAVPLAFASHFALDALPHYGIPHKQRNTSTTFRLVVMSDAFISFSMIAVTVLLHKWRMLALGLLAYSPDVMWAYYYFTQGMHLDMTPNHRFMKFHRNIQRFERPWGIWVELVAGAIMFPFFITQVLK